MSKVIAIVVGLGLLGLLLLFNMTYQVRFNEVAIKSTFGQTSEASIIREPGLKFKLPFFINRVRTIDTRMQHLETALEQVQTADKRLLVARAFLIWRANADGNGPLHFTENYESIDDASNQLRERFRSAVAATLSRYTFNELIGNQDKLTQAEEEIRTELLRANSDGDSVATEGIIPVTVGINQMVLPAKTTSAVVARMETTRTTDSEYERVRGRSEAERIESEAKTIQSKILAFANQRAEEIRNVGNEKAAEYLEQMGSTDEELAIFLLWIQALEATLQERTTLVLPTNTEPWHLLDMNAERTEKGIPLPQQSMTGSYRSSTPEQASPPDPSGSTQDATAQEDSE